MHTHLDRLTGLLSQHPALAGDLPQIRALRGADLVAGLYQRLVAGATGEVLVFNRPPYGGSGEISRAMIEEGLARGVRYQAIHQAAQLRGPHGEATRRCIADHCRAGVETRVTEALPIKLAVIDRRIVLLAMPGAGGEAEEFPANLLVDDGGFAAFAADAFALHWAAATPLLTGTEAAEEVA